VSVFAAVAVPVKSLLAGNFDLSGKALEPGPGSHQTRRGPMFLDCRRLDRASWGSANEPARPATISDHRCYVV